MPKSKAIRICSPQLGLNPKSILGGEIYDHEVLRGLADLGAEIEILLPKNRPYNKSINNWQVNFLPIKHVPAPLFNFIQLPYLFSIYKKHPFPILRVHSPYYIGLGAMIFKWFHPQVKLIATHHQARENFPFGLFNKIFAPKWDHIIIDSQAGKKRLVKKFKVKAQNITVIHGGAPLGLKPTPKNQKLIKKLKLRGYTVLLFMGFFTPRKNPLFLIKVMKKLIKSNKKIKLILCGSGPQQKKLDNEIQAQGLTNHIIIHRPVFKKDKQNLYSLADIFVHPSLHEGFPLVLLEAMACGLPIIINKGYSAKEAVRHGNNGYLCKINHLVDWLAHIKKLAASKKLQKQFGKNSLKKARKIFSWKNCSKQHFKLINQLAC